MNARSRRKILRSGAGNTAEADVVVFLDKYFETFENNLKDNNFSQMNTNLAEKVIDKFGILFRLWDENRILQNSIDKQVFENIHKSMSNALDDDGDGRNSVDTSDDVSLECNHCGENFALRNNNIKYSYDLHSSSKEHVKFVENFNRNLTNVGCPQQVEEVSVFETNDHLFISSHCNACKCDLTFGDPIVEENMDVFLQSLLQHLRTPFHINKSKVFRVNKRFIRKSPDGDHFICGVCLIAVQPLELLNHFEKDYHIDKIRSFDSTRCLSSIPLSHSCQILDEMKSSSVVKQEVSVSRNHLSSQNSRNTISGDNSVSVIDLNGIVFKNGRLRCKICQNVIFQTEGNYFSHLKGKEHRSLVKLYRSNSTFLKIDGPKLYCTLCNYSCQISSKLLKHCHKTDHVKKVELLPVKPTTNSDTIERASELRCVLCGINFDSCGLFFRHFKLVHNV